MIQRRQFLITTCGFAAVIATARLKGFNLTRPLQLTPDVIEEHLASADYCYKHFSSIAGSHMWAFAKLHIRKFIADYIDANSDLPIGRHEVEFKAAGVPLKGQICEVQFLDRFPV